MTDTNWRDRAACNGMDPTLFDSLDGATRRMWGGQASSHPRVRRAQAVCAGCPVRAACLADGLATHADGVRGGEYLTAGRRTELRRKLRAAA